MNTDDRPRMIHHDRTDHTAAVTQKKIFVVDSNPVLVVGLMSILAASQYLSKFMILTCATSDFNNLECGHADILIFDPKQVLRGSQMPQGFFLNRAKATSLVGYCSDISRDDLGAYKKDGFRAVMPKVTLAEDLLRIICAVSFGGEYFHQQYPRDEVAISDSATAVGLTARELAVLRNIAKGIPIKQIAALLDISAKTVDTYKTRASHKLNLSSRAEIIQFGIKSGWMN